MKVPLIALILTIATTCLDVRAEDQAAPIDPRAMNRQLKEVAKKTQLDKPAEFLKGSAPRYPSGLRYQDKRGSAVIMFTIAADGTTKDLKVVETSDERISKEIVRAIEAWKFKPAEKAGKPVSIRVGLPFDFSIF